MELELRHLRTVRAIADTGSLTKAAAALGLAQPALSAQLRRIEKALGGPLFERDHTGARPTLLGELVLERACGESPPPANDRLTWQVVGVDPVFVMLPDSHPLAGRRELDLAGLADECWADVPGDGCFADCFVGACARAGFSPVSVYETDTASVVHLVQVGRAVGLCRATFPPTPGLVTRPLAGSPLSWRHLLGWHPRSAAAASASGAVSGHTRAAYAEAVERSESYTGWLAAHPRFGPAM